MTVLALADFLESVSPWILVTVAIALVGVDIMLTNDDHLMWIGFALLPVAVANAIGFPGDIQVVVFAAGVAICMIYVRRLVRRLPRREPEASRVLTLRDCAGTILDVEPSSASEGRAVIVGHGEWRVRLESSSQSLNVGQRIRVVDHEGMVLIVRTEP